MTPCLDVVTIWQAEMLLRRHIAKHCGAEPADHGSADGRGDALIARSHDPSSVAQACRTDAPLQTRNLPFDIFFDQMHRYMARAFNHHLCSPAT